MKISEKIEYAKKRIEELTLLISCWEKEENAEYLAALTMNLVNEPGALADVSKIISNNGSNIQSVLTKNLDENFIELTAKILVKDIKHLELINQKLIKNKTVTSIERKLT